MNKQFYEKLQKHIPTPIIWISVILILIIVLGVLLIGWKYYGQFQKSVYSSDITLWGYFGDFWWNLIIAITSILNLIAFVFITIMVAKMQDTQSDKNKKHQELLLKTQLKIQLKTNSINDLLTQVNSLLNDPSNINECAKTAAVLESFQKTFLNLFKNNSTINTNITDLIKTIDNRDKTKIDYIDLFIPKKDEIVSSLLQDIQNDFK